MSFKLTANSAIAAANKPYSATELSSENLHFVDYSRELWMTAQAGKNGSVLSSAVALEPMSSDEKTIDRLFPVEYEPFPAKVTDSTFTKIDADRRKMRRISFKIQFVQGMSEAQSVTLDLLKKSSALTSVARARLIDREILRAQIKPAQIVTGDVETDYLGDTDVQAKANYNADERAAPDVNQRGYDFGYKTDRHYRVNLYFKAGVTNAGVLDDAAGKSLANIVPDDLEDIIYILKQRNATEGGEHPCATMTPKLRKILAKHADWKNSERQWKVGGDLESHRPFWEYKGVYFKDCVSAVLPNITSKNILSGYTAGTSTTKTVANVAARAINHDNIDDHIDPVLLDGTPQVANTAGNIAEGAYTLASTAKANGANSADPLDVLREHMVYFWYPRAVKVNFGGMSGMMTDVIPTKNFARTVMHVVSMAACLCDEDYALQFILPHPRLTIGTKGTGTKGAAGVLL